jgi:protein ImuA
MTTVISLDPRRRRDLVAQLQLLLRHTDSGARSGVLTFGIAALDSYLPYGGLSLGALHDIVPDTSEDLPAAFGFIIALICCVKSTGPVLIVTSPKRSYSGQIHGHGFNTMGLDPNRAILIEAEDDIEVHWVIEEALKSRVPAVIAALPRREPDLKTGRRLHLAAEKAGLPLLLLKPSAKGKTSAGLTRWRIGAAPALRDRFSLLKAWRWRVALERCRNGRTGDWLVEFDHDTHRFSLAQAMADRALSPGTGTQFFSRRSG